jgi:hypothetical protein
MQQNSEFQSDIRIILDRWKIMFNFENLRSCFKLDYVFMLCWITLTYLWWKRIIWRTDSHTVPCIFLTPKTTHWFVFSQFQKQLPSSETNTSSTSQKISCIWWNQKVHYWRQNIVISVVTRYGLSGVRILAWAGDFCLLQNIQTGSVTCQESCWMGTGVISRQ